MKEILPYTSQTEVHHRIQSELASMTETFARELTPSLAAAYIRSLTEHIGYAHETYEDFVKAGKEVHRKLGREVYGPLIVGFVQWAEHTLTSRGVSGGPVHFALRDAWPFYTAAHVLWDGSSQYHAVGTYINRPLLGVEDEIAPEHAEVNGFVKEYLGSGGFSDTGRPVALIDSGAWGTVTRKLKELYVPHTPFHPLFWYSHNPAIRGFVNELLEHVGLPPEFGEVINDSLECVFPQSYRRPVRFNETDGSRVLTLEKSDPLSVAWGQAALEGVSEAAHQYKSGISDHDVIAAVKNLYELHVSARADGQWTGVLPAHTPTWSQGDAFLAAWPDHLLP